jgi:hypothetical protein
MPALPWGLAPFCPLKRVRKLRRPINSPERQVEEGAKGIAGDSMGNVDGFFAHRTYRLGRDPSVTALSRSVAAR